MSIAETKGLDFESSLPASDAYARQAFAGLRSELCPGQSRYTEIHLVDQQPYLVVSPRPDQPYDATISGYHSITDTIRLSEANLFPDFMNYVDNPSHRLDSTTIWAKGNIALQADGEARLQLSQHNRKGYSLNRLVDFLLTNQQNWGIDQLGLLRKDHTSAGQIMPEAEQVNSARFAPRFISLDALRGSYRIDPNVTCGVVTRLDVNPNRWSNLGDDKIAPRSELVIRSTEANSVLHAAIYHVLDIDYLDEQSTTVPVRWEGEQDKIGVRYVQDKPNNYISLSMYFLSGEISPRRMVLATMIRNAFVEHIEPNRGEEFVSGVAVYKKGGTEAYVTIDE